MRPKLEDEDARSLAVVTIGIFQYAILAPGIEVERFAIHARSGEDVARFAMPHSTGATFNENDSHRAARRKLAGRVSAVSAEAGINENILGVEDEMTKPSLNRRIRSIETIVGNSGNVGDVETSNRSVAVNDSVSVVGI